MATWYVRPNTTHNVTRNGNSYSTAWGGWSEIIWGGVGVVPGDTLYVCGTHSIASAISVGNHGATTEGGRVTISGGYEGDLGSIVVSTTGSIFLQISRNYTSVVDLTITANTSNCIFVYGALTGVTISGNTLNAGTSVAINVSAANGNSYTDLVISNNEFIGGSGSSTGSAITWFVLASGTPISTLNRVTVDGNTFTDCSSTRAVIHFRIEDGSHASSKMADIIVSNNTFTDCYGVAMEIYGPGVYGRNTGFQAFGNTFNNQQSIGVLGGGMSIGGFAVSLTPEFGHNIIRDNNGYIVVGPTGLINVFYGTYIIYNNYGEDLSTPTIDANGLLFDHGCDDCHAFSNTFKRITGKADVANSGCGIMVLDATNVRAYGNLVIGCRVGIYFGNKSGGQSCNIHNNTFLDCNTAAIDVLSTADLPNVLARDNLFGSTSASVPSVKVASGTWTGESYNAYNGFAASSGHTLHATDITADPVIDAGGKPLAGSPLIATGTFLGGKGVDYKTFWNPPCIGAYEYVRSRTTRS